jgi:alkane 1-monooxygenase
MAFIPYLTSFLLPIVVIGGNYFGGFGTLWGLILMFFCYPVLDIIFGSRKGHQGVSGKSLMLGESILRIHVLLQMGVVGTLLWRGLQDGSTWTTFAAAMSSGCVGGASGIIVAHELGHRRPRSLSWWMSQLNLLSVCYNHYTTEHNHNHHLYVGTDADPATAPVGRGLWAQMAISLPQQFFSSWRIQAKKARLKSFNPMLFSLLLQVGVIVTIGALLSWWASLAFLLHAFFAIILLEYVNYIRHYGLRRGPDGKQTEQQSWQTEARWTGWTLFEVSLHPDHHLRTSLPFWKLRSIENAPTLPVGYYGLFWVCAFPPLWRRWIDSRIPILKN